MKKVVTIVGARPQFVKAAAFSNAIKTDARFSETLVHTGQHYDFNMSGLFFKELGIPEPAYHLGIGSGPHGQQTGKMLAGVEEILLQEKPDWIIVFGDTNSTIAGALAGSKLHIPVAHIEAGLRSFNRNMPEEINRILTDHCSTLLFAPTNAAANQLKREGIPDDQIHTVGDIMFDASLLFSSISDKSSRKTSELGVKIKNYILATIHRAENTDDPNRLDLIFQALLQVSQKLPVIVPLHPRTRAKLSANFNSQSLNSSGLKITDPVGYLDMIHLEKNAAVIATDSGGVQKEAFFYSVPCVTLRQETEWNELVDLKWNRLIAPTRAETVAESILEAAGTTGIPGNPYGSGNTATQILEVLSQYSK